MFQKHQGDDRAGRPIRGWHAAGPGRPGEAGATGVDRPRLTRRSTCTIRRPLPEVGTFKSKRWARRWLGESKPLSKTGCRPGMGSVRRQRVASISDAIGFPSSTRKQHPGPRLRYKHAARARVRIRARSATQRRRPASHKTNTNRRPGAQTRPASDLRVHRLGNRRGALRESWKVKAEGSDAVPGSSHPESNAR